MDIKDLIGGNENELEEITSDFKINNNILEFRNRIIQLKNVESISIVEPKKKSLSSSIIVGILIGLAFLSFQPLLGILILLLCFGYVYLITTGNKKLGKNVYINLVSGYYIVINFNDHQFAYDTVMVLRDYLNGCKESTSIINIKDSNITLGDESPIFEGNDRNERN